MKSPLRSAIRAYRATNPTERRQTLLQGLSVAVVAGGFGLTLCGISEVVGSADPTSTAIIETDLYTYGDVLPHQNEQRNNGCLEIAGGMVLVLAGYSAHRVLKNPLDDPDSEINRRFRTYVFGPTEDGIGSDTIDAQLPPPPLSIETPERLFDNTPE